MSNAYQMGCEAFNRGDDIDMNPFDDRDGQFDDWEDGRAKAKESRPKEDLPYCDKAR